MSSRKQRVERLLRLRQQKLDAQQRELARARLDERQAEKALAEAREAERQAARSRRAIARGATTVHALRDAGDWAASKSAQVEIAAHGLQRVRLGVRQRIEAVVKARRELEQLELLLSRVSQRERLQVTRAERSAEDEIAQRVAWPRRGGRQ